MSTTFFRFFKQFIPLKFSIQNDEANSAKLLEKGVDILKAEDKVALAEKLYFKKVAKQLGFSAEDIEEAMN